MKKRFISLTITIIILTISMYLLGTGSELLIQPFIENPFVPFGSLITWFGLISMQFIILIGIENIRNSNTSIYKTLRLINKLFIILAILWIPICYILAGNFSNTFANKETFQGGQLAMKWFWRYTYSLGIVPILILLIHWIHNFYGKLLKK